MPTSSSAKVGNPAPGSREAASQHVRSVCHDLVLKLSSRLALRNSVSEEQKEKRDAKLSARYTEIGDYIPQCTLPRNTLRIKDEEELSNVAAHSGHTHTRQCALKSTVAISSHVQHKNNALPYRLEVGMDEDDGAVDGSHNPLRIQSQSSQQHQEGLNISFPIHSDLTAQTSTSGAHHHHRLNLVGRRKTTTGFRPSWNSSVSLERGPNEEDHHKAARLRNVHPNTSTTQHGSQKMIEQQQQQQPKRRPHQPVLSNQLMEERINAERAAVENRVRQEAKQTAEDQGGEKRHIDPEANTGRKTKSVKPAAQRSSSRSKLPKDSRRPAFQQSQGLVDLGNLSAQEIGVFDTQVVQSWEAETRWVLEKLNYPLRYVPLEDKGYNKVSGQSASHRSGGGQFPSPLLDPLRNGTILLLVLKQVQHLRKGGEEGRTAAVPKATMRSGSKLMQHTASSDSAASSAHNAVGSYDEAKDNFVKALKQARQLSAEWLKEEEEGEDHSYPGGNRGISGGPEGTASSSSIVANRCIPHSFLYLKVNDILTGARMDELWGLLHTLVVQGLLFPLVQQQQSSNTALKAGSSSSSAAASLSLLLENAEARKVAWMKLLVPITREGALLKASPHQMYSRLNMQKLEASICSFLHNYGVVYDLEETRATLLKSGSTEASDFGFSALGAETSVHAHVVEGEGALSAEVRLWGMPRTALEAPYLPTRKNCALATSAPKSLADPNVLPFLANGVMLCELLNRTLGTDLNYNRNPRLPSKCKANLETAMVALRKYEPSGISGSFLALSSHHAGGHSSTTPSHVASGGGGTWVSLYERDLIVITLLLEDIMRLVSGAPPRAKLPSAKDVPFFWRSPLTSSAVTQKRRSSASPRQSSPEAATSGVQFLQGSTENRAGTGNGHRENATTSWLQQHRENAGQVVERRPYDSQRNVGATSQTSSAAAGDLRSGTMSTHRITNTHLLFRQGSNPRENSLDNPQYEQKGAVEQDRVEGRRSNYSPVPQPEDTPPAPQQPPDQVMTGDRTRAGGNYYQRSETQSAPTTVRLLSNTVTTGVPSSGRSVVASNDGRRRLHGGGSEGSQDRGDLDGSGEVDPEPEAAYTLYLNRMPPVSPEECHQLRHWFFSKVGYNYKHVGAANVSLLGPQDLNLEAAIDVGSGVRCLAFRDGVALAHLISVLCYHKVPALNGIEKHPRSGAARRFNLKRCIGFLQKERKMFAHLLALEQALEVGEARAVVLVLRELKVNFKNHRGSESFGPSH